MLCIFPHTIMSIVTKFIKGQEADRSMSIEDVNTLHCIPEWYLTSKVIKLKECWTGTCLSVSVTHLYIQVNTVLAIYSYCFDVEF